MIYTKEQKRVVKFETAIQCDICGKKYTLEPINEEILIAQEFVRIRKSNGFSSVFGDISYLSIDICDSCFKEMLLAKISDEKLSSLLTFDGDSHEDSISE